MSLKSLRKQQLSTNGLVTVAPASTRYLAKQTVKRFRVRIGDRMIKVVENLLVPIGHGSKQWLKGLLQVSRNALLPVLVQSKSLITTWSIPEIEKRLFQIVSSTQQRQVLCPNFQNELLRLIQVRFSMQQNVPIMHQSLATFRFQIGAYALAYLFQSPVRQAYHMKTINHDGGLRQDQTNSIGIWLPHVHCDKLNVLALRKFRQSTNDGLFRAIRQKINHALVLNIAEDSIRFGQVNLVDTEPGQVGRACRMSSLMKDETNGFLVQPSIFCNTGEGPTLCCSSDIVYQSLRHHVSVCHFGQGFPKLPVAVPAEIAMPQNLDACSLAMQWGVHEQLLFFLMAIQQNTLAMRATRRACHWFCKNLVAVERLNNVQNVPMLPVQDVHGGLLRECKARNIVLELFFLRVLFPVRREKSNKRFPSEIRLAKTIDAALRLFTAQVWAYTPYTIARWVNEHTDCHVTEEQVANYLMRGVQMREIGQWSKK